MYATKAMQLLLSALFFLINFNNVAALPTAEVSEIETRAALHDCSVFVQRWCQDCDERFDVAYYNVAWSSPWNWPVSAWWNQLSTSGNTPSAGSELVPIQVGSNILHIVDVANPTSLSDAGKLSFSWGSQSWNSFGAGSPCDVDASGAANGGAVNYECKFQCDK